MGPRRQKWTYPLERLYEDQDPAFVLDVIAQLICWLDPHGQQHVHPFELRQNTQQGIIEHELIVSWSVPRLAERDPRLEGDLARYRNRKTLTLEDRPKYAAYGLAMVAVSCILQRRIVDVSFYKAPDLLLDPTRTALRGVEVAGRTAKGHAAFAQAIDGPSGKRAQLLARQDVAEAYLSLWCSSPKVSIWEKVKP